MGKRLTATSDDLRETLTSFKDSVITECFNSAFIHKTFVHADEEPDV